MKTLIITIAAVVIGLIFLSCQQAHHESSQAQATQNVKDGTPPHAMEITPEAKEEARRKPNGYVYVLDGKFGSDEKVPPEAIVGAWKVDAHGQITGEFIPNPNYKAGSTRKGT